MVLVRAAARRTVAEVATVPDTATDVVTVQVPTDAENAALIAMRATYAAGNPLSGRQLEARFGLTRAQATKVRQTVLTEASANSPTEEIALAA